MPGEVCSFYWGPSRYYLSPTSNLAKSTGQIWLQNVAPEVIQTLFLCQSNSFLWAGKPLRTFSGSGRSGANQSSLVADGIRAFTQTSLPSIQGLDTFHSRFLPKLLLLWSTMAPYYVHLTTGSKHLEDVIAGCFYWCGRWQRVSRSRHQQLLDAVKQRAKAKRSSGYTNTLSQAAAFSGRPLQFPIPLLPTLLFTP